MKLLYLSIGHYEVSNPGEWSKEEGWVKKKNSFLEEFTGDS